jgi:hypothetical protein
VPDIDELLRSAAERAAAATTTPPLSAVRRRHTRRRAVQTGAGSVVVLAAVTAATLALRTPTAESPNPSPAASRSAGHPLTPSSTPSAAAMQTAMVRTTSSTTLRFQVPFGWQVTDADHCMTSPFAVVVVPFEGVGVRHTPPRCPTPAEKPRVLVFVHSQLVGSFMGCGGEGSVRTIEMTRAGAPIEVWLGPFEKGRRCVSGGSYELQLYVHADTQDGPEPVLELLRTFERQP